MVNFFDLKVKSGRFTFLHVPVCTNRSWVIVHWEVDWAFIEAGIAAEIVCEEANNFAIWL